MKLEGKVALVTGAGRGLGRAYALHLAKIGADVVINDILPPDVSAKEFGEVLTADTVMDEVRALGRKSITIQADVSKKSQIDSMFDRILSEFGRIDILVNNAGGLQKHPERSYAATVPEEDLRTTLDGNLMGTIFCCQAASRPMIEQKSGKIVNVASLAAYLSQPGGFYASYGAAKAGIIAYTKYLACQLAHHGINVNCIVPGPIGTKRLMARMFGKELEAWTQRIPLGRLGTPEDCAKVIEFLCTDLSDYLVGQCIIVDGGLSIWMGP